MLVTSLAQLILHAFMAGGGRGGGSGRGGFGGGGFGGGGGGFGGEEHQAHGNNYRYNRYCHAA